MIVHIKRQDSNGTVSNFCVFAIDENEAKLKVKDLLPFSFTKEDLNV